MDKSLVKMLIIISVYISGLIIVTRISVFSPSSSVVIYHLILVFGTRPTLSIKMKLGKRAASQHLLNLG